MIYNAMMGMFPYREIAPGEFEKVEMQMRVACNFLLDWERYKPAIGGGALWAWSAGKYARDVDIFAKSTFFSRRKAKQWPHDTQDGEFRYEFRAINDGYGVITKYRTARRYMVHGDHGVQVDLVLTPFSGLEAVRRFDYYHCQVGFAYREFEMRGATYYASANLYEFYRRGRDSHWLGRDKTLVLSKVQKELWGKAEACDQMEKTLRMLDKIYVDEKSRRSHK